METQDVVDRLQADWATERPDLDTEAMAVVGRLILLGDALKKRAADALEPFGLGYSDLDVLATLRRHGAPYTLRPADLLRSVLLQSGSLTACLDRLQSAGWIERVPTPGDRRSRSVRLTPSGLERVDHAIAARFAEASDAVSPLATADRELLTDALRRFVLALHPPGR